MQGTHCELGGVLRLCRGYTQPNQTKIFFYSFFFQNKKVLVSTQFHFMILRTFRQEGITLFKIFYRNYYKLHYFSRLFSPKLIVPRSQCVLSKKDFFLEIRCPKLGVYIILECVLYTTKYGSVFIHETYLNQRLMRKLWRYVLFGGGADARGQPRIKENWTHCSKPLEICQNRQCIKKVIPRPPWDKTEKNFKWGERFRGFFKSLPLKNVFSYAAGLVSLFNGVSVFMG